MQQAIQTSKQHNLSAILWVCVGFFIFTLVDALGKYLVGDYPKIQIMCISSFFAICTMGVVIARNGGRQVFKTDYPILHIVRGIFNTLTGAFSLVAMQTIQLDQLYAVVFTAPLVLTCASALFLKEHVGWHRWVAVLCGVLTIFYMFRPGQDMWQIGSLFAFLSVCCYCTSMIIIRKMGPNENRLLFPIPGHLVSVVALIAFVPAVFVMPDMMDLARLVLMGVLLALGTFCLATGFQRAENSAAVAPYQYSQLIWGMILGYMIFDQTPTTQVVTGAVILAAIGIYLAYRENKNKDKK